MPFRAETAAGYVMGVHQRFMAQWGLAAPLPLTIEPRYRYNQSFQSIHAIVPGVAGLLLIFIPAILAVLSVVREKEMGSIANLYVTPTTRLEFILGKQIPYIIFSFGSFLIMVLMTVVIFGIAVKGSLLGLLLGALVYITVTTGYGLLISSFTESQIAALAATAITCMIPATQFSGLLQPVSTLEGPAYWIGTFFPTTYFIRVSVGTLTKGLEFGDVLPFIAQTALFIPVLLTATVLLSRKQEV
jgi:ribosome-dependent ATPase